MTLPEEVEDASFFDSKIRPLIPQISSVLVGAVLAFAATGVVIWTSGKNPLAAFQGIAQGSLGTAFVFALTLDRMTPILLTALATIVSFRTSIWNVGQEGQLYIGALFATWTALSLPGAPWYLVMPAATVAGIIGGFVWSGIAGLLYIFFQADAVIATIMLNYVALLTVDLAITGPIQDPTSLGNAISKQIPLQANLPIVLPGTPLHAGFLIAMIMPILVYVLMSRTTLGYSIRAMGHNTEASRYAGIRVRTTLLAVFGISGALCGLAGAIEVQGFQYRLLLGLSPGYGSMGIIASLLGGLQPFGAVFASLFTAALLNGTQNTAISIGVSTFLVSVLQGITIIAVLALSSQRLRFFKGRR